MFRFTIRDVMWLTLIAALLTLWAMDHWRKNAEIRMLRDRWEYDMKWKF